MKKVRLIAVGLLLSSFVYCQSNAPVYMGYAEAGYQRSYTSKNHFINGLKFSYNSIIKDKYLIGLNYLMAFENKYLKREHPNHINSYTMPYLNFGIRSKLSKNFYISPSVGVGYGNYKVTRYKGEETGNLDFDFNGNITTEFKITYSYTKENVVAVPVNLNLLYTSKYFGVGLNLYMIASKYMEAGAGLSINFGKIK